MVQRAQTGPSDERATDREAPLFLTFVFADIRGWTRFTRERGAAAAGRLAKTFADLARDAVEARGGEVFELRGDEADAVFESPTQAVRAAVELQQTFAEVTAEDPTLPLLAGIGIDAGEVVRVEDGFRGSPLNMAGRLCSIAAAGQVLASPSFATLAQDVEGIVFEDGGTATLKGFEGATPFFEALATPPRTEITFSIDHPSEPGDLELATDMPLVGRDHEMRWARGTWRRVCRGSGHVVCVSGPSQIGKTRLAADIAAHVDASGGTVRYTGAGGTAIADALAAVHAAAGTEAPTLVILDDLDAVADEVAAELAERLDEIGSKPALVLLLAQNPDASPVLSEVLRRIDVRGDAHRTLQPLDQDGVGAIGRAYVGDEIEHAPIEAFFRSSGGVPGRIHEVIGRWAGAEATRRLSAAAEWLAAGRTRRADDLQFANNVLGLKLDQLFQIPEAVLQEQVEVCPYKGLAAFKDEDAALFFGRERLVGELAARSVDVGLLGVVGASGSGKSSSVAAGLLPSLAAGLLPGSDRWRAISMRPGEHPMDEFARAVGAASDRLRTKLDEQTERLLLVVDQFEETFTLCTDEAEREAFVDAITGLALASPDRAIVVLILRADFYGHCAAYPDLARLLGENHVLVGPMSKDEFRRAIELPARRAGLRVESALTEGLVDEVVDEPGGLPLLSTALVELWQQREGHWLRAEAYERTGGVHGAVARLAESTYAQLSEEQKEATAGVLLRLVGPGEGESVTRRRVPLSEFDLTTSPTSAAVIARFVSDRLLTSDEGTVEVAHEALLWEWPRLRGWLAEDAQGRELRTHLATASRTWEDSGEEDSELYRGARLSATLDWASSHGRQLNDLEHRFLTAGRQAGEREIERQRRTNHRLRGLLVGVAIFLAVALIAGSLAVVQSGRASRQRAAADAQALKADAARVGAESLTEPNLDRAMLMALAGVQLSDEPQTRLDLFAVLQRSPEVTHLIRPSKTLDAIALSPDGKLLASVDNSGILQFESRPGWTTTAPSVALPRATMPANSSCLYPVCPRSMAFSPDGRTLIVGVGAAVEAVDVATGIVRTIATWPGVGDVVTLAVSADGRRIAVGYDEALPGGEQIGGLALIDPTGRFLWKMKPYPSGKRQIWLRFRPHHPNELVTSKTGGPTLIWNVRERRLLRTYKIGGPLALSPDGRYAALAQNRAVDSPNPEAGMALLDLRTRSHRTLQGGLNATFKEMAYSPDGHTIIAASFAPADDTIRLWDTRSGRIVTTLAAQSGGSMGLALSTDGRTLFSAASDASIAEYDLSGTRSLRKTVRWTSLRNGCLSAPCMVVNPQGTLMAASRPDGSQYLIDLATLRSTGILQAKNSVVGWAAAFFPDGRRVVTNYGQSLAEGPCPFRFIRTTTWDARTTRPLSTFTTKEGVESIAVSPDGTLMAMLIAPDCGSRQRVLVRDVATGRTLWNHPAGVSPPINFDTVAFDADGTELASSGTAVFSWDAQSGERLYSSKTKDGAGGFAFQPQSQLLAYGTQDGHVLFVDPRTGVTTGSPIRADGGVLGISFSPDGRTMGLSTLSESASTWDVASGAREGTIPPDLTGPSVSFTEDGTRMIVGYEGWAAIWPTDLATWERYACQVAGRDLTQDEWSQLLPGRPFQPVCPSAPTDVTS